MRLINLEKWPYLLTVLTGLVVWHLNNLINHETTVPILALREYTKSDVSSNDTIKEKEMVFTITNLSQATIFKHLDLFVSFRTKLDDGSAVPDPRKIYAAEVVPVAPSPFIDSVPAIQLANDEAAKFIIPSMQPGTTYKLFFQTKQHIKADEYPRLYINSDQPIQFRKYWIGEWIIENIFFINVVLLLLWAACVIIYLIKYKKHQDEE